MKKQSQADVLLLFLCISIFTLAAFIRVSLNQYSLQELLTGTDDWNFYARYGLDIKENGLLIKSVEGNYLWPAGFLYNYFVAACFLFFNNSPTAIYIIQSALLGFAVAVTYFLFRHRMKNTTAWIFLFTLILFGFADIFKNYSFRLLSENLALLTVVLFFYFFQLNIRKSTPFMQLVAGLFLGVSTLTRPNILPFTILFSLLLAALSFLKKINIKDYWFMLLCCFMILLLLPLRNYLVTGDFAFLPVNGSFLDYIKRENEISLLKEPLPYLGYYGKKILYCLGFLPVLDSNYQVRPHWIMMWAGYFIYIISYFKKTVPAKHSESFMHLFILIFYGTLILIAPIQIYGFRIFLPCLFLVLGLALMGFETVILGIRK